MITCSTAALTAFIIDTFCSMSSSLTCPASCPNSDLNLALMSSSSISICAPESQVYSIYSNLIKHKDTGLCRTSSTWLSTGSSISLSTKRSINDEDRTSAAKNMFFYQAKQTYWKSAGFSENTLK